MEKTPVLKTKSSGFHNHRAKFDSRNVSSDNKNGSFTRSDTNVNFDTDNEESPMLIACTQDGSENIDVVWDWNSPQAKNHPKKCQKRLILPRSPKIPLKKFPSNNSIQNFEKLREELQALRQEIALPENEDSLILSPREEADYKDVHKSPIINSLLDEFTDKCFDDMFDEKLTEFSEKVEQSNPKKHTTDVHGMNSAKEKISFKKTTNESHLKIANDSFESLLSDIDVEKLTCPSNGEDNIVKTTMKTHSHGIRPTKSVDSVSEKNNDSNSKIGDYKIKSNIYKTNSGKVEFHRTQSFELTNLEHSGDLPKCKLDEIEKKRREAKAKLEMKRKHDQTISLSQSQCSSEEIENKRLHALAKLEAKRQQDIIERKRQEALKRLQANRKRNAMIVKSSLTERLD